MTALSCTDEASSIQSDTRGQRGGEKGRQEVEFPFQRIAGEEGGCHDHCPSTKFQIGILC